MSRRVPKFRSGKLIGALGARRKLLGVARVSGPSVGLNARVAALALGLSFAGCSSEATIDLFPRTLSAQPSLPASGGAGGQPLAGGSSQGGAEDAGARPGLGPPSPSTGGGGAAGAAPEDAGALSFLPVHRYRFDGTGDVAIDDIAGANGVIIGGATQDGSGAVTLDGNDDYVDLPNGIVSALVDATFSAWVTWNGNNCWHRVFSFGNTAQGEDIVGDGVTELFVTPVNCTFAGQTPGFTALYEVEGQASLGVLSSVQFDAELHHVGLVFEDATPSMTLYLDGESVGSGPVCCGLSELVDENNWLGQSQWDQDFRFPGVFETFSIYDQALSPEQIAMLFAAGPE